jgi:hypothetical protein
VLFDSAVELELTRYCLLGVWMDLHYFCVGMVPSSCVLLDFDPVRSGIMLRLEVNGVNGFVNFTCRVGSYVPKRKNMILCLN